MGLLSFFGVAPVHVSLGTFVGLYKTLILHPSGDQGNSCPAGMDVAPATGHLYVCFISSVVWHDAGMDVARKVVILARECGLQVGAWLI